MKFVRIFLQINTQRLTESDVLILRQRLHFTQKSTTVCWVQSRVEPARCCICSVRRLSASNTVYSSWSIVHSYTCWWIRTSILRWNKHQFWISRALCPAAKCSLSCWKQKTSPAIMYLVVFCVPVSVVCLPACLSVCLCVSYSILRYRRLSADIRNQTLWQQTPAMAQPVPVRNNNWSNRFPRFSKTCSRKPARTAGHAWWRF